MILAVHVYMSGSIGKEENVNLNSPKPENTLLNKMKKKVRFRKEKTLIFLRFLMIDLIELLHVVAYITTSYIIYFGYKSIDAEQAKITSEIICECTRHILLSSTVIMVVWYMEYILLIW
ncbi:hypothetical protein BDC45DRAFT_589968 [Circinella umbellata]|nr:hypothetical protein BDC45DRAFT_589968 [Circinella umbellata]